MEKVAVRINFEHGIFEIESPVEKFESVLDASSRVYKMMSELRPVKNADQKADGINPSVSDEVRKDAPQNKAERKSAKSSGNSSNRPGRLGSFDPIKLELSEDAERDLIGTYASKKPKEQIHKAAVAMCLGEKHLGKTDFSYNEIYTLMRLCGEKNLPKALDVVIDKMVKDNWAQRDGGTMSLKFLARDFVEQKLPVGD